jgi:S-adenosylmethionine:tRNA-ribosyltransferase-isomerase (queuine synthetase)
MLVSDFHYDLPEELIAQQPPAVRGASRMLTLDRRTGAFADHLFTDLPSLLQPGDLLLLNDSRVLPARLFATRAGLATQPNSPAPTGHIEVLLTQRLASEHNDWLTLVKPAKKIQPGETLYFHPPESPTKPGAPPLSAVERVASEMWVPRNPALTATVLTTGDHGERTLRFAPTDDFHATLERIGHLPLPPYIHRDKHQPNTPEDRERYQTVYSEPFAKKAQSQAQQSATDQAQPARSQAQQPATDQAQQPTPNQAPQAALTPATNAALKGTGFSPSINPNKPKGALAPEGIAGSAAAPTAGLHFTPEILQALQTRGIEVVTITLHVGLGTFQPIRVDRTEDIRLHAEPYTLSAPTAAALNRARAEGRRILAVGTTTTRTLEHIARQAGSQPLAAHSGTTSLFLSPSLNDDFQLVTGLLTNFHLPSSTLLMLVSAFAGREPTLAAYAHAVAARYRFFSYGDCMLIL